MLEIKVFRDIIRDGYDSIQRDSDDELIKEKSPRAIYFLLKYALSLFFVMLPWFFNVKLSAMEDFISSGTAIFTGLFFSLLLSVGDKIRKEKENENKDNDNYRQFKNNMKQISKIILLTIFIGILLFVTMLLNKVLNTTNYPIIERIFTSIALFLLVQFLVTMLFMTQRFYFTLRDELANLF